MTAATLDKEGMRTALMAVFSPQLETLSPADLPGCDPQLDREWAQRANPRLESWLSRLQALEMTHQQRVARFLALCREEFRAVPELHDEFSQKRMERTWGAVTEYFESVMPDELLTSDRAELTIDAVAKTGWWTADAADRGVELHQVLFECLRTAGEISEGSARTLLDSFTHNLLDGTAPLPGFEFKGSRDGLTVWEWVSANTESAEGLADPAPTESGATLTFRDVASEVALALTLLGGRGVDAGLMRRLMQQARQFHIGEKAILQELGAPLALHVLQAVSEGNISSVQRAIDALYAMRCDLQSGDQPIKEAQGLETR